MRRGPALLLALLLPACGSPPRPDGDDLLSSPAARDVLRPADEADAARISGEARYLAATWGFSPGSSLLALRDFRDLLDRPDLLDALHREPALGLAPALVSGTGYAFAPRDAGAIARAASGPAGAAIRDPAVVAFLARARAADLLAGDAGADLLALDADRASALRTLASDPGAGDRLAAAAARMPVEFSPADAAAWLGADPLDFPPPETAFLAGVLAKLRVRARSANRPELATLAARQETVASLLAAADEARVRLSGPGAILVLARLAAADPSPLDGAARGRLADLAGRRPWPDAGDFLFLVPLARAPGIPDLLDDLSRRYRYRFEAKDGDDLLRLLRAGVPEPARPRWVREDRLPLVRPGDLLSPEPAAAFADPNDLRFMESLARARPDLADTDRGSLEDVLRRTLRGRPVRHRLGAPYPESTDDLSGFLRPDLLKAFLVLEALDRGEFRARIFALLEADLASPGTEVGGWLVLEPAGALRIEVHEAAGTDENDRLHLPARPAEAALEFHFHATDQDDSAWAGPSSGGPGTDLFRAATHRTDGLVITKLRGVSVDIDLYTSGKYVLDLGVLSPSGRTGAP